MTLTGQLLAIAALGSALFLVIEGARLGWTARPVLVAGTVSVVCLIGFLRQERRSPAPLLELRLLRSRPVVIGLVISLVALATTAGFLFLAGLELQILRALDPLGAAVRLLPVAAATIVLAPVAGRLVARRGPRVPLVIAGVGFTTGSLVLLVAGPTGPLPMLVLGFLLFGIGFGMVDAPITTVVLAGLPQSRAGVASGLASTSRQVGQAFGVALFGSLLTIVDPAATRSALTDGAPIAWELSAGAGLLIAVLAMVSTRGGSRSAGLIAIDRER